MRMHPFEQHARVSHLVQSKADLIERGWAQRSLERALVDGRFLRLSRTRWIEAVEWARLWPEQRLLARVLAAAPLQRGAAVFCRESAAVLHGLPLYSVGETPAQVLVRGARTCKSTVRLRRHTGNIDPSEVVEAHGIPYTSLGRTILDLARYSPADRALACIDRALRHLRKPARGELVTGRDDPWINSLLAMVESMRGRPGSARAARLLPLADAGAESVLESVGRLRLWELGYAVRTQPAIPTPTGAFFYADLELEGLGILVEVDGKSKYTDPELRGGRTAEEVVFAEKRREEWIRESTGKRVIRLSASDLLSRETLRSTLRGLRVPPPSH